MSADTKYRTLLRRVLISELAIALILVASGIGFEYLKQQKPGVESREIVAVPLNVDTFNANAVTFREIITAYGTARADREVVVAAQVSGEIVEVHPRLEVGLRVTAPQTITSSTEPTRHTEGDTLLQIDQRDYANRSRQAKNRINETEREIEQLKQQQVNGERVLKKAKQDAVAFQQQYDRYRRALELNAGAETELNRALVELQRHKDSIIQMENQLSLFPHQIASAEERLSTSEAESQRAEDDLARTRILPPFNGVVSELMVEQGQFVRAGEALLRLTDPDRIDVPVAIGLGDWHQIESSVRQGRIPSVSLASTESSPAVWSGRITRVAPVADPGSRTIQAFVEVLNDQQPRRLLPGTFVHARITGGENTDQVIIPRSAILNDHVYIVESDSTIRRQRIQQGRRLRSLVVVRSGLSGGEQIAMTNLTLLENGREVAVQESTGLAQELKLEQYPLIELVGEQSEESTLDAARGESSRAALRE